MKTPLLLLTATLLTACAPLSSAPDSFVNIPIPQQWMFARNTDNPALSQDWWKSFQSPTLNLLIDQGNNHNHNLRAAALTWQKALLAVDSAALNQSITTQGSLSLSGNRDFKHNSNSQRTGASFSASYQLDLWQKLAKAKDAAQWSAQALSEDLLATTLSLQGDIAKAYFQLLYYNDALRLNQAQLDYQQDTYQRVEAKQQLGAASELDVTNARQSLLTLNNARNQLQSARNQAQITLNTLLGQTTPPFNTDDSLSTIALPRFDVALPASILAHRPDLRAAQYRLQADFANVQVAERDFYPNLNLNASVATNQEKLRQILQNPIGSLATSLALPFLQYRENRLQLKSAQLQYQIHLEQFQQTLYDALADVEKAFIALNEAQSSAEILKGRLEDTQKIVALTQERYRHGADSLQTLLDAQQVLRDVQNQVLENRHQHLQRIVSVYLALGG